MLPFSAFHITGLSLLSALLLWLAWPPMPSFFLVFAGFVPLLFVEQHFTRHASARSVIKLWGYVYLSLLVWNVLTTWWIWNAAGPGSIPAFTLNTLLMTIPWLLFHYTKKKLGKTYGYASLIIYWLTFEYLHMRWELTWPWLTLGNVFAKYPMLIQWYEYTGHLGGSVWVLITNVMLFHLIIHLLNKEKKVVIWKNAVTIALIVFLPVLISLYRYNTYTDKGKRVNVTVVQPNIEPYVMKFDPHTFEEQWNRLLSLSANKSTPQTQFVVWPETSIPGRIWINNLDHTPSLQRIRSFLQNTMPQATLIAGVDAYEMYDEKKTITARQFRDGSCCYDAFNSAFQIDSSGVISIYHKSKLVPGVERMPYPQLFGFLENFAIDLGGTTGSLGTQEERTVFTSKNNLKTGVAICYESVFGEFVGEYIRNGAQSVFIITNDGWWYDTPGHKQHLVYASLRAVETRKSIARSANTGISCFINQRGDIQQATRYDEMTVINQDIYFNDIQTFYTRYGDLTGRIAMFLTVYLMLLTLIKKYRKHNETLCSF
jgi:apolipoprotein N-acyltransferase